MQIYRIEREMCLARPRPEVFEFFSDAGNLEELTPDFLRFEIVKPSPSEGPIEMAAGRLIDYRLRVRGVPIRWRSVIRVWEPPVRFVDEQVRGPYRTWYHEHLFEERDGGTAVIDRVDYAVPGGPGLERLVHRFLVGPDVRNIFDYRQERLEEIFGEV